MNAEQFLDYIRSAIVDKIEVSFLDDGLLIQLPFTNYRGEPIEIGVTIGQSGDITINDIGYISGSLFELNEHTKEAPGHLLTKRLADSYELNMDYNEGTISEHISIVDGVEKLLNFVKVVTSIETVLPFISKPHKRVRGRKRLNAQLSREITQLRFPLRVERPAKVEGKHEIWDVEYKYTRKDDKLDVLILVADLGLKEPKERAAHVVTLASDVLDVDIREKMPRELRVVYSLNGNGSEATRRAASIIEDYQHRIGYKAFDYSNSKAKSLFTSLTIQDLSPMRF
jgi:hypothetical protein